MKYQNYKFALSITLASLVSMSSTSGAQVCDEETTQSALQYLRRASLDLRGHLPSMEELNSVVTNQAIDPLIIENMVDSDEVLETLRAYHRDLLWTNVENQRLAQNTWLLATNRRGSVRDVYFVPGFGRSNTYRGAQISCQDKPQSELGYDNVTGLPNTETTAVGEQEGYVMVEPYWAPGTSIKVCAFDAQDNLQGTSRSGLPIDCYQTTNTKNCGCGPKLKWCHAGTTSQRIITRSFNEQMFRFLDNIVDNNRPYTDILTAKDMEVNGPIVAYFRDLWNAGQSRLFTLSDQNYTLPNLGFSELENWQTVNRGERHAGLLTMPGFLVKFQSNRGRANRFYNAFLCQQFQAPDGGLPASDDDCHNEPNLTKRCGCKYCHITLEPAAAHWGRWAEAGLAPLNEGDFPKFKEECVGTAGGRRNSQCRRFYLREALHADEEQYVGTMLPYVFADQTMEDNIAAGPVAISQSAISSGAFASCTVKRMWELFMSREPEAAEADVLATLTEDFKTDHNLRRLIKKLVTRSEYIEAGRFKEE